MLPTPIIVGIARTVLVTGLPEASASEGSEMSGGHGAACCRFVGSRGRVFRVVDAGVSHILAGGLKVRLRL